ncbi:MAG: HemK family protein methyltransferase [Patescibacteria group bacterium]
MNKPIEYKRGFCNFLGCKIDLSQGPMIPRKETEFWVKKAIKNVVNAIDVVNVKNIKILDVFAGSGCIGIAILKNIKNVQVNFTEINKKFLKQIKINLKLNKINFKRYKIIQSDIFNNLRTSQVLNFDYIFANPPYIALKRKHLVQNSVYEYEPHTAIFGGEDGLLYIRKFLKQAKNHLKKHGKIYLEFDYFQKNDIEKLLNQFKYKKFQFFKDQFQKWRWVVCS